MHAGLRLCYDGNEVSLASDDDTLGEATGGSPYPVAKPRPLCKHGCGKRAAPRQRQCETCRDKQPARREHVRRRQMRQAAKGGRWSGVGASIPEHEWVAIWRAQAGLCLICLHPLRNRYDPAPQIGARNCALDHDHQVESQLKKQGVAAPEALRRSLRGLLCGFPCNRIFVRHWTPERLENAARYAREMPAQKVLNHA